MIIAPGHTLGKYRIEAEIGRGGMGVVYRGYDPALRRSVAIKVLPPQMTYDAQFVGRFRQEAVMAASLRHPGIVTIHDVGQQGETHYIVMEYLEGETLEGWLRRQGPLSVAQASRIVQQVAEALDYAHSRGVIHRDIKPANIMMGPDGRVTLMDFGLVRAAEGTSLTRSGQVMGTPEYMAPEQALGEAVDARSDVYALGVLAYKLLSGQVPFSRSTPYATTYAHIHDPLPPLRLVRGDLPAGLEAVVGTALAKRPEARYQRAGEFAAALTAAATGQARPAPQPARTGGAPARPRRGLWLAGAGLLVFVVAAVVWVLSRPSADESTRQASAGAVAQPAPTRTTAAMEVSAPTVPGPLVTASLASGASTPTAGAVAGRATATPSATIGPGAPAARPTATPDAQVASAAGGAPALTPSVTAVEATPRLIVSRTVNMRSGPGTNYPVIGQLAAGQTAEITGRNAAGDWWQFNYNGQLLWVSAQVVQVNGSLGEVAVVAVPILPPPATASGSNFVQLSLVALANANLKDGYANPPLGQVTLGGVPFDLKAGETVTTQAAPLPNNLTRIWLPASAANVRTVYLLLTGGDLYLDYDRRPFGKVRLLFADNRDYALDLIGGINVREWKHGSGVVTSVTSPDVSEVWRSSDRYDGSPAIIDLLRIAVPADLQSRRLEGLEILDTSAATVGNLDPAINLLGVTLAVEAPPAPPTATPLPACGSQPGPTFARVWDRVRIGCPTGQETGVPTAYEPFERGWMLWRSDNDGHYALFSDGRFAVYWYPAAEPPNYACPEAASAGMPRRGFSRVWCENPDVRQRIGRALSDEVGDYRPVQTFERGFMVYVKERGTVVSVYDDGAWKEVR